MGANGGCRRVGTNNFANMTKARQTMGLKGEHVAAKWLTVHGWAIAERRFRNGRRDIDLVATRGAQAGRTVAFTEQALAVEGGGRQFTGSLAGGDSVEDVVGRAGIDMRQGVRVRKVSALGCPGGAK